MTLVMLKSQYLRVENNLTNIFYTSSSEIRITWGYIYTWKRQPHPTPVLLPGKSHGQRSLVGCSSWGCEESDTTERVPFHFSLSCVGEGNGNPLVAAHANLIEV